MNERRIFGLFLALGCFGILAVTAHSQAPKLPEIPGFEVKPVEGFTLVLHPETLRHEKDFPTPPSEVLKLELRMLAKILNPKALAVVKRMPIWVEWDEPTPINSLAKGKRVTAYYNTGNQAATKLMGKHALQSKTITICSLRSLTSVHQPGPHLEQCVLLHEVAHAVHDELIGQGNQEIVTAYKQAMSRRLCDPKSPAGADFSEFFAEMTCAYLDRLDYFPHNRAELKAHDPVTFKVVEKFWGRTAAAEVAKSGKGALRGLIQEDLSGVRIGIWKPVQMVQQSPPSFMERKGKLLALGFWHDDPAELHKDLDRLHKIQDRFGEWGIDFLLLTSANRPAKFDQLLRERAVAVPVCAGLWPSDPAAEGYLEYVHPPKGVVIFDSQSKAIFRGADYASEAVYRKVLMTCRFNEVLQGDPKTSLKPFSEKKEWKTVRAQIDRGDDLPAVLKQLAQYGKSPDKGLAEQARRLKAALENPLEDSLNRYQEQAEDNPVKAYLALNALAGNFKGTEPGAKARSLADSLKNRPEVQAEIKAQDSLETIRKFESQLDRMRYSDGSYPKHAKAVVAQAQTALKQLEDMSPDALATAEGRIILRRLSQITAASGDSSPKKP